MKSAVNESWRKRAPGIVARASRRFFSVMRLMTYLAFAFLLCGLLGARVVYADLKEGTLEMGRELAPLNDVMGTTKNLFINGANMNVSTAIVESTPHDVLDRFDAVCKDHPQILARAFADIPEALKATAAKAAPNTDLRFGVMRSEANGDGALTCFTDDKPSSIKDLPERIKAFRESYDLSVFGRFRYVYAAKLDEKRTRVTTVWTDGSFSLKKMFPAQGDADGADSPVVPRPPNARRILSASAAQAPFGLHIYDSTDNRDDVRRYYDAEMTAMGWNPANDDVETHGTIVYVKDTGRMLYVTLSERKHHTMVTAIETARANTTTEAAFRVAN